MLHTIRTANLLNAHGKGKFVANLATSIVCVCVCVCVTERERETNRQRAKAVSSPHRPFTL